MQKTGQAFHTIEFCRRTAEIVLFFVQPFVHVTYTSDQGKKNKVDVYKREKVICAVRILELI